MSKENTDHDSQDSSSDPKTAGSVPSASLSKINHLLKEVYLDKWDEQLSREILLFNSLPKRPELTRKQKFVKKWKRFWNHIPDFFSYLGEYKYEEWRYWDKDGY